MVPCNQNSIKSQETFFYTDNTIREEERARTPVVPNRSDVYKQKPKIAKFCL
ncbi:hypothetical protein HMPREF9554_00319 [Treponema phagedenis F0421]|nr:hypothetical protein HMPREF9554_00319 [Treponema phagedenis F0421]